NLILGCIMNILSTNDWSFQPLYRLKDKILDSLSPLQKKTLVVALIVFSALAVLCFVSYKFMNNQRKISQDQEDDLEGLNSPILNVKQKINTPEVTPTSKVTPPFETTPSKDEQVFSKPLSISIHSKETKLQDLLQDLLEKNCSEFEAAKSLIEILPKLDGSVLLYDDQLAILKKGLNYVDSKFVSEHLSPGLLACLVRNSLLNSNLTI